MYKLFLLVAFLAATVQGKGSWESYCPSFKTRFIKEMEKSSVNQYQAPTTQCKSGRVIDTIFSFPCEIEILINMQIEQEMKAFYTYLAMSHYFGREDMDFPGFKKYFKESAMEELKHAEEFIAYLQRRGGRVHFHSISPVDLREWKNATEVMRDALRLEKTVTNQLMCLHEQAELVYDVDFINFLEGTIIPEQYTSMKSISNHIKTLEKMSLGSSPQLAEYQFDKTTLSS